MPSSGGNSTAQSFELPPDEGIYGLGQHQSGVWNYRLSGAQGAGVTVTLAQRNTDVDVPAIASNKGYMLLWDNPAVTHISVGAPVMTPDAGAAGGRRGGGAPPAPGAGPNVVRWSSEFGKAIDYYVCYRDGSPQNAPVHFMLAQVYRRQGLMDKAKIESERYTALAGTDRKSTRLNSSHLG